MHDTEYSSRRFILGNTKTNWYSVLFYRGQKKLLTQYLQIDTLNTAMSSNSSLKLHMNLDLNRTTRPGPHSPVNLLTPLVQRYPDRVHISLYRSPALHGLLSKVVPPRFNEGWGTWHAKIYGTDNEVLLSG
jgi:CDP-diacylglycerol--glycerol-3-phosphate 3-phosphatidyltransferase